MKKILIALTSLLLIAGCSSSGEPKESKPEEKSVVLQIEAEGILSSIEIFYTADEATKEDIVIKSVTNSTIDYSVMGFADEADAKEQLSALGDALSEQNGVSSSYEYTETSFNETVNVIFSEMTDEQKQNFSTAELNENGNIVLESYVETLKSVGYTEQTK
ncbi:MAG: DUF1307 domain-containing protein [Anaerorhabdus sp.]